MNRELFLTLLHNTTLLLATSLVLDVAFFRIRTGKSVIRQVVLGLALGIIGIAVMMTPWTFIPGIVFDTRSILIGVTGLFFGPLTTLTAMAVTGGFRLWIGGGGTVPGIATILSTGTIGLVWRRFRRKPLAEISGRELYLFGLVVNGAMLACQLILPRETAIGVLSRIGLPVLAIYPLGTALLGVLLVSRIRREQTTDALKESEAKLQEELREKEILFRELQHRVKNSMTMIHAMVCLEMERTDNPAARTALENIQGRIKVLSDLYGLFHTGGTTEIRLDLFLRKICESVGSALSQDRELVVKCDEISLDPKKATAVGLILNELLTNAHKYAFPGRKTGKIGVALLKIENRIIFSVRDDGVGLPAGFSIETSLGLGLLLVKMFSTQLGGDLRIESDSGTKITLEFGL